MGGWKSGGTLVAHLSDNSAVDYVDSSFSSTTGQYKLVYTLTYRAASAGQRLVVNWTQASGTGNVTLQGAALAAGSPAGSLGGAGVASFATVDLTASGTGDWAKWPNYIHKASGGAQIPNFTKIGTGTVYIYNNDQRPISWSDGTPTAAATADVSGNYVAGIGNGFQISAPADTTMRTLYVYVGGWKSGGTLVAHLSDNSAVDYVDSSFSSTTGQYKLVYTLTYRAASAGQRLVVNWTQASGTGNVTLQGAALAGRLTSGLARRRWRRQLRRSGSHRQRHRRLGEMAKLHSQGQRRGADSPISPRSARVRSIATTTTSAQSVGAMARPPQQQPQMSREITSQASATASRSAPRPTPQRARCMSMWVAGSPAARWWRICPTTARWTTWIARFLPLPDSTNWSTR